MWLPISQITVAVLLIIFILLQERTSGLSGVLGGDSEGGFYQTRRGLEKMIFWGTVVLAIVFAVLALLGLVL
jgi:protein translocase SecG subunit